jgi:membrane-associated HD superfamily phosphohydrolase
LNTKTEEKNTARSNRYKAVSRAAVGIAAWVLVFALAMVRVLPEKYNFNAGEIANQTIQAPHDIVDTITTEKKRQAAIENVPDKYRQDDQVTADVLSMLQECYNAIADVKSKGAEEISKLNSMVVSQAFKDDK